MDREAHADRQSQLNKVMLFVMAIAIHNLPEGGLLPGLDLARKNIGNAITVAIGIALCRNIPEGMVIVSPLIMAERP